MNWYIKHPKTNSRSDYYLQPFDKNLWLAFIFSIIILNIIIVVVALNFDNEKKYNRSIIDYLFIGLDTCCSQGGYYEYENIPLRILYLILRIVCYIATASLSAVIVSFLTIEIPQIPFKTFEEFLQVGDYKLLVMAPSLAHSYLKVAIVIFDSVTTFISSKCFLFTEESVRCSKDSTRGLYEIR